MVIVSPTAFGQQTSSNPAGGAQSAMTQPNAVAQHDDRYRIGAGDVLEIRVFERPQLTRDAVRVDGSGQIRMPLVSDDIVASCLTESELAAVIAQSYRAYLKNPQVDVFVKQFSSQPVSVIGAVGKPGSFQLERRVRLRELISLAGGPTQSVGRSVQVIHDESAPVCSSAPPRSLQQAALDGGKVVVVASTTTVMDNTDALMPVEPAVLSLDLDSLMRGQGMNPYVRPGDFINLPQADQVFVVGNVFKPTAIDLKEPLTLSRAVAIAGGTLASTKKSAIHLIRATANGNLFSSYDLTKIEQHTAPDPLLQAGDIVEVSTSLGKQILRGTFTTIAPAYAVYGPLTVIR